MNVFLWVNSDLDGVGSTILLGNIFKKFEYKPVFFGNFEEEYFNWYDDNFQNYDKVFVVGMPLNQNLINRLDDKKVVFVSDSDDIVKVIESSLLQERTSSCSKLLYKKFSKSFNFSKDIQKLVAIIDDYNSYNLKLTESKILNALFRKSGKQRFYNFVNNFWNGFKPFTDGEIKVFEIFENELQKELSNLEIFKGTYKGYSVLATFSNFSASEIASSILSAYSPDIVIVVNLNTKFVSFRKRKDSKSDIVFMATNICGGGGSEFASGGQITSKFLEFTTTLEPLQ
jgi:oligoribonuclease NrnB/cAMP/cGMP phosphodiesterase (DHH superfamily)